MSDPISNSEPTIAPGEIIPQGEPEAFFNIVVQAIKNREIETVKNWISTNIEPAELWMDLGLITLTVVIAWIISRLFKSAQASGKLDNLMALRRKIPTKEQFKPFRISLVTMTWLIHLLADANQIHAPFLKVFTAIVTLFFLINLPSRFIEWKSWMKVASTMIFIAAGLEIMGLLDSVTTFLDQNPLELGTLNLTVLDIIKGIITFFVLLWLAGFSSRLIAGKINRVKDLSPHVKVLLKKGIRVGLYALAILLTLGVMGVKLTAFAVFGGAFGLGIGFGLQKVISNLVSGIILLLDKSVKPGDVIEIGNTYGWINSLNLRYASVITRDNKEHLIPNEDLITNPVINWTYSDTTIRVRSPFGISYDSDLRLAMKLAEESAASTDRVVSKPEPRCNLVGFGDSSIDLELRFFIKDPHNGVGRVRSEVLLGIWDAFAANGIKFPFPQRDVNLRISSDSEPLEELSRTIDQQEEE